MEGKGGWKWKGGRKKERSGDVDRDEKECLGQNKLRKKIRACITPCKYEVVVLRSKFQPMQHKNGQNNALLIILQSLEILCPSPLTDQGQIVHTY